MNNFDTRRAYEITLRDQEPVVVQNIRSLTTTADTIDLHDKEGNLIYSIPVSSLVNIKRLNARQLTEQKRIRLFSSKRKPSVVLTSEQWLEALNFAELGFAYKEIAEAFNVSENSVYIHLRQLRNLY